MTDTESERIEAIRKESGLTDEGISWWADRCRFLLEFLGKREADLKEYESGRWCAESIHKYTQQLNDKISSLCGDVLNRDKELDAAINAYDSKAVEHDALKAELEKVKADNAGLIEGLKKIAAHEGKYYPVDTMVDIAKEALAAYTEWEKGQGK